MVVFPGENHLFVELGMSKAFTTNGVLASIPDDCGAKAIDRFHLDNAGWEALGKLVGIFVDDRFGNGNLGKKPIIGHSY